MQQVPGTHLVQEAEVVVRGDWSSADVTLLSGVCRNMLLPDITQMDHKYPGERVETTEDLFLLQLSRNCKMLEL